MSAVDLSPPGRPSPRRGLAAKAAALPSAATALAAAGAGLFLALHHPLAPWLAAIVFVLVAFAAYRDCSAWLLTVPALLPVLSFAPWTGWLTFEEVDLLVLAVLAGGHARRAVAPAPRIREADGSTRLAAFAIALLVAATLVSMRRGFVDAGGFEWGWYQGYHEPMNSLRIAKGPVLAALLWPLWLDASHADPARAAARLRNGIAAGLLAASLAALWERLAFPGLLDFSTDYRTTALFWEMHVGGAALDGFLALTMPFALLVAMAERRRPVVAAAAVVVALGSYACLTTFSRGVYLAIPVGLAVFGLCSQRAAGPSGSRRRDRLLAVALVALSASAVAWMFPSSGYRGALALVAAIAGLLATALLPAPLSRGHGLAGIAFGIALAAVVVAAGSSLPKGPYVMVAALVALGLAASERLHAAPGRGATATLIAAAIAAVAAMVQVAAYWGGQAAFARALPVAAVLGALVLAVALGGVRWPARPRWHAGVLGGVLLATLVVVVFSGGAYMSDRFATSGGDLDTRLQHWREGLALLKTPGDLILGRGLGRYPGADYVERLGDEHPGDYRLRTAPDGSRRLVLASGRQMLGFGEVLRLSQRVAAPGFSPEVRAEVRTAKTVDLHVEVCEKHLLYNAGCQLRGVTVAPGRGDWQTVTVRLDGAPVSRGLLFAPRQLVFSIGLGTPSATVDVRRLALIDDRGQDLLANGRFEDGLAHWFFSSDRYHLPWHVKNMALDLLLDQGAVGLVLVAAMLLAALARLTIGRARFHPLAPALAAAFCGFVVVGFFDSLLDVPRLAVLFYLLTFVSLALPATPPPAAR